MEEIEYGNFQCSMEDCTCEFGNSSDLEVHMKSGVHGRIGDRFAEQNRKKFKYFSRQGRVKEQIYRKEGQMTVEVREESRSIDQENNQEKLK